MGEVAMTPNVSIFLRTYHKDAPWLVECLRSMDKFCSGFSELVIHVDDADVKVIAPIVGRRGRLVHEPPHTKHGYINQQVVKLHADKYTAASFVFMPDSDYVFTRPTTPDFLFRDGKPCILYQSYKSLAGQTPWQRPTEQIMGRPVAHEFMRRPRLIWRRETLVGLRSFLATRFKAKNVAKWLSYQTSMSEHNLLGAFAFVHERDKYSWINTETDSNFDLPVEQFWSYGSITPAVREKIENYLR